jgi:uncharacterized protein YkwD
VVFRRFLIALLACLALAGGRIAISAPKQPDVARVEGAVIDGTNDFRRAEGRQALKRNAELEATARAFAEYMARTGKFDHGADGSTPAARAERHGYDYCFVAENISRQYSTAGFGTAELARQLVEGWKQSPGHRRNMLEPDVVETAVAIAHRTYKGYQDYYAVQLFGRPKSARIEFQVRNGSESTIRYRIGERSFSVSPRHAQIHTECGVPRLAFEGIADRVTAARGDKFVVAANRGILTLRRE